MTVKVDPKETPSRGAQTDSSISEPTVEGLSEREKEVLFLAGDGLTDKEIANRLQIGPKTVRTYWDRMRAKLNAASRTEVLAKALRAAYDDLARTEHRLRMFVEHMPVLVCAVDEATEIPLVNEEFARLSGYEKEELIGDPDLLADVMPDAELRSSVMCRFRENCADFRDLEGELTGKEGKRWIAWSSRAASDPVAGWSSWAIGIDVTERNRAQVALQNSEAALRKLLESSELGVWIIDNQQHTTFVNQKLATMFGSTVEELMQTSYLEGGDSAELVREMLLGGGGRVTFTQKFKKSDGSDLWASVSVNPLYDDQGNVNGYAAVLTDITQRKSLEQSLHITRQHYFNLLNHSSDQILRFNKDYACVYANFELTRTAPGESPMVEGRNWEEIKKILQPATEWLEAIRHVFDTGQRMWLPECYVGSIDPQPRTAVLLPEPASPGTGPGNVLVVVSPAPVEALLTGT